MKAVTSISIRISPKVNMRKPTGGVAKSSFKMIERHLCSKDNLNQVRSPTLWGSYLIFAYFNKAVQKQLLAYAIFRGNR